MTSEQQPAWRALNNIAVWRRRLPRVWARRAVAATVLITVVGYGLFCPEASVTKEILFRRQFGEYADVMRYPVSATFYTITWDGKNYDFDFKWTETPTTHFHGLLITEQKSYADIAEIQRIVRYTEPIKVIEYCGCAIEPEHGARIVGRDGKAVDLIIDDVGQVIIVTKTGILPHKSFVKDKETLASLLMKVWDPNADPNRPPFWFR